MFRMKDKKLLTSSFFERDTLQVAHELLGKYLYRKIENKIYRAMISETEAYHGTEDLACHCSKGKTPRTEVMFGKAGKIYVYLIYGMYEMLNFVTMEEGFPAAVLIRGVKNLEISTDGKNFIPIDLPTDGPGKLTKRMQITRDLNKRSVDEKIDLYIMDHGIKIPEKLIGSAPRIGIDYAGKWKDKPWRFYIKNKE